MQKQIRHCIAHFSVGRINIGGGDLQWNSGMGLKKNIGKNYFANKKTVRVGEINACLWEGGGGNNNSSRYPYVRILSRFYIIAPPSLFIVSPFHNFLYNRNVIQK